MLGAFKHSYKTKTRESLPIAIYNSGVQQCDPSHFWGPGIRDHYLIHHVISGCGVYLCDGIRCGVSAGDTFIVYPSAMVSYHADSDNPWEYCWVGFNGADAQVLIGQTPFQKDRPVVRFPNPEAIQEAILAIYHASGLAPSAQLRAIGSLYLFLALLTELAGALPTRDLSLEYVESAVRYITHNYSGAIDVGDIASHVGISRSQLYRVFMREIGSSPNEYLIRFRISRACELMDHSSLPISAVAASVGYEDALYFSRVFKKTAGCSPRDYHKRHRGP